MEGGTLGGLGGGGRHEASGGNDGDDDSGANDGDGDTNSNDNRHRFVAHELRLLWSLDTRNTVYSWIEMYKAYKRKRPDWRLDLMNGADDFGGGAYCSCSLARRPWMS